MIGIKVEPHSMQNGDITALKITKANLEDENSPTDTEILETNLIPFRELDKATQAISKHYEAKAQLDEIASEFEQVKSRYIDIKEEYERTQKEIESITKRQPARPTAHISAMPRIQVPAEEASNINTEQDIIDLRGLAGKDPTKPVEPEKPQVEETLSIQDIAEKNRLEYEASIKEQEEAAKAQADEQEASPHIDEPDLKSLPPHQQAEKVYDRVLELLKGKSVQEEDILEAVLRAGIHPDNMKQVTQEIIKLLDEKGAVDTPRKKIARLLGGNKKKDKVTKK